MATELAREIASCFTASTLRALATGRAPDHLKTVLRTAATKLGCAPEAPVASAFDALYSWLRRHYRSEYVYKNALTTKLVLSRHTLDRAMLLRELTVDQSVADIVVINGTSTVYEIKTELDTLARLPTQLASYRKAFDHVCVVTHPDMASAVLKSVTPTVGILVLSSRYTLQTLRPPASNLACVEPAVIFDLLRQDEYIRIVGNAFGFVPEVGNARIYTACRELFVTLSPERAHAYMVAALHERRLSHRRKEFVASAPHSLKLLALATRFSRTEETALPRVLGLPTSAVLA